MEITPTTETPNELSIEKQMVPDKSIRTTEKSKQKNVKKVNKDKIEKNRGFKAQKSKNCQKPKNLRTTKNYLKHKLKCDGSVNFTQCTQQKDFCDIDRNQILNLPENAVLEGDVHDNVVAVADNYPIKEICNFRYLLNKNANKNKKMLYFKIKSIKPSQDCKLVLTLKNDKKKIYLNSFINMGGECLLYNIDVGDNDDDNNNNNNNNVNVNVDNIENTNNLVNVVNSVTNVKRTKVMKVYKKPIKNTIDTLLKLNHDNLERFYDMYAFDNVNSICIYEKLTYDFHMFNTKNPTNLIFIFNEVFTGLCFLHKVVECVHLDLNETNIMFDSNTNRVKITDLTFVTPKEQLSTFKLYTSHLLTPLLLFKERKKWHFEVDYFQLFLMLYYFWNENKNFLATLSNKIEDDQINYQNGLDLITKSIENCPPDDYINLFIFENLKNLSLRYLVNDTNGMNDTNNDNDDCFIDYGNYVLDMQKQYQNLMLKI